MKDALKSTMGMLDIYTDVRLAMEIEKSGRYLLFMISASLICAPYIIVWCAASAMNAVKLNQNRDNKWFAIGSMLFNIAPIGILVLFIFDICMWIEYVSIRPFYHIFTGGRAFRNVSYNEMGYQKLKSAAQIYSESLPQLGLQIFILLTGGTGCEDCTLSSVIQASIMSCISIAFWGYKMMKDSKRNGIGFAQYVTVVFQGSFNFVEKLPAIQRGTKKGVKVNWAAYKFNDEGPGNVAKALNSPSCRLELLKMSKYTIKDLYRFGCRFLGGSIAQSDQNIELIISRSEDEIMDLFKKYDTTGTKSLDFEEFVRFTLDVKQNMMEPCLRSDVFLMYEELADSVEHEVKYGC